MNYKPPVSKPASTKYYESYYKVPCRKLTEADKLPYCKEFWGILSDYELESVKVNNYKDGEIISAAVIRIEDIAGQVTCKVKGHSVGVLFGLTKKEWKDVESLSLKEGQVFYRYFKNGLNKDFSLEQKLFYMFCRSNQRKDVLAAVFQRCKNYRNKDKKDAFIEISHLFPVDETVLSIYESCLIL